MASLLERVAKLEQARALAMAHAHRQLDATTRATRCAYLMTHPTTPRASRVAALFNLARDRAFLESIA